MHSTRPRVGCLGAVRPACAACLSGLPAQIKADMFSGFVAEVVNSVQSTDPETAAALESLHLAHQVQPAAAADTAVLPNTLLVPAATSSSLPS